MKSPRSIIRIGRLGLLGILAADLAWLRQIILSGHSIFGFDARGFDALILPMATILVIGLNLMIARRGRANRFLLGFAVGGCFAVAAYAICGWTSPDTVRSLLRPVYLLWSLGSIWNPPDVYLFPTTTLFITLTQWLIALAGGWLAEGQGNLVVQMPRVRVSMRAMMIVVAIAALGSMGLARWFRDRRENDPWTNAIRWSEEHEARAKAHLEAARRYPETAEDRLRMAKAEKAAASSFQAEAKRLKP